MDADFTVDEPFIDPDGNSLWVVDFEDEGIFLYTKDTEGNETRIDLDRISVKIFAGKLAAI